MEKQEHFSLRRKVETKANSNGKLEAILINNNSDDNLRGEDYVVTSVNGRRYRFYANGKVTGEDGEDSVGDKAVTGKSKEILEKWNLFLTADFK